MRQRSSTGESVTTSIVEAKLSQRQVMSMENAPETPEGFGGSLESEEKISEELSEILKGGSPIIRIVDSVDAPDMSGNIRSPLVLKETDEPVLTIDDTTTEFDLINMVLTFFGMENRHEVRSS